MILIQLELADIFLVSGFIAIGSSAVLLILLPISLVILKL